jgi:hypothetical protein
LYNKAYPSGTQWTNPHKRDSGAEEFRTKAEEEGFSEEQIDAFLNL